MNLYGFAGGDPVNFSDPFGLCPPCDGRDAADLALGSTPVVSTLLDAATLVTGKNIVTGEDASRLIALAGLVSPAGGGQIRAGGKVAGAVVDAMQRFANKHGVDVSLVGSRAAGTATISSDWDYVVGGTAKTRKAAKRELPHGSGGIDIFNGNKTPVDPSRPHITVKPDK
jgi:hypothetical protein